jgi:hypothetical protein
VSGDRTASPGKQKALLRARAEADRTRIAFALREIRTVVAPVRDPARVSSRGSKVVRLVGILATVIGVSRVARLLRFASYGLTAFRIARNWRRMH